MEERSPLSGPKQKEHLARLGQPLLNARQRLDPCMDRWIKRWLWARQKQKMELKMCKAPFLFPSQLFASHILLENKQPDTNRRSPKDKKLITQLNDGQQNEMGTPAGDKTISERMDVFENGFFENNLKRSFIFLFYQMIKVELRFIECHSENDN